jgi:hypothetical protein
MSYVIDQKCKVGKKNTLESLGWIIVDNYAADVAIAFALRSNNDSAYPFKGNINHSGVTKNVLARKKTNLGKGDLLNLDSYLPVLILTR